MGGRRKTVFVRGSGEGQSRSGMKVGGRGRASRGRGRGRGPPRQREDDEASSSESEDEDEEQIDLALLDYIQNVAAGDADDSEEVGVAVYLGFVPLCTATGVHSLFPHACDGTRRLRRMRRRRTTRICWRASCAALGAGRWTRWTVTPLRVRGCMGHA